MDDDQRCPGCWHSLARSPHGPEGCENDGCACSLTTPEVQHLLLMRAVSYIAWEAGAGGVTERGGRVEPLRSAQQSSASVTLRRVSQREFAENREVRLRDVLNLIIGIGIAVAPWFNGEDAVTHGAIRLRIVAACICALSLWIIMHQRDFRAEVVNAVLGLVLVTSPLWRGGIDPYRLEMAAAGMVVAVFSASCAVRIFGEPRDDVSPVDAPPEYYPR